MVDNGLALALQVQEDLLGFVQLILIDSETSNPQ